MALKILDGSGRLRDMTAEEESAFNAARSLTPIVPSAITRTQFFKQVHRMGVIDAQQAKDAIAMNALPPQFTTFLAGLSATDRDEAEMDLLGLDVFRRDSPKVEAIRQANGWTQQQTDTIWIEGSKL